MPHTPLFFALLLLLTRPLFADQFLLNAGGPSLDAQFICDDTSFLSSPPSSSLTAFESSPTNSSDPWVLNFRSHRYATVGDLTYSIPVPHVTGLERYQVFLFFMEVNGHTVDINQRVFNVAINGIPVVQGGLNGGPLDVFAKVGAGNPFFINAWMHAPVDGFITISLNRIAGKGDPMISAIGLVGNHVKQIGDAANCVNDLTRKKLAPPQPGLSTSAPKSFINRLRRRLTKKLPYDICARKHDVFINAGGMFLRGGWRCDTGNFVSAGSASFSMKNFIGLKGRCTHQFLSHQIAESSNNLLYSIPVPAGTYTLRLMFMEFIHGSAGKRSFFIDVNDLPAFKGPFDIWKEANGSNKPYVLTYGPFEVASTINIMLRRIVAKDDPMIAGIAISSANANADRIIRNLGINNCRAREIQKIQRPTTVKNIQVENVRVCPGPSDLFFNMGGSYFNNGYRCDNGQYVVSRASGVFINKHDKLRKAGGCIQQYNTHRYAYEGLDLSISIPVPKGIFDVYLMFMEVYYKTNNSRLMTVTVNGKAVIKEPLDVFKRVGGNTPFLMNVTSVIANNAINITLGRIPGKGLPMISGIGIVGNNATKIVGSSFLQSCSKHPPKSPFDCATNQTAIVTDFTDKAHLAHAVSGGPYVETDFDKDAKHTVQLNGLGSHSHASVKLPGYIIEYKWKWTDWNSPLAVNGVVTVVGPTPAPQFPGGVTKVTLEVQDQYCNRAGETTSVTVNPSNVPGAYCYYYNYGNSEPKTVPLPFEMKSGPDPGFGISVGDINFISANSFGDFSFKNNSYAVRCVYQIRVEQGGMIAYDLVHNGPIKVYSEKQLVAQSDVFSLGTKTRTKAKYFPKGVHNWQILYFRTDRTPGLLKLQFTDGTIVPGDVVRHDASTVIPVITGLSKKSALANEFITIYGSSFVNEVVVKFGSVIGEPVISNADSIELRVPPAVNNQQIVDVVIETEAGHSNGVTFEYGTVTEICQSINFSETNITNADSSTFEMRHISVLKYGPDRRLYLGTTHSELHVLSINKTLHVTGLCSKNIAPKRPNPPRRYVLGLAFNPNSTKLQLYFSTSTMYWKDFNESDPDYHRKYAEGWTNGKVQRVTLNGTGSCFNDDITDIVQGLPVSNHDHGVNFLQFLPDSRLLISVGGVTNGGMSHPGDGLGGIPPSLYSGSIISCNTTYSKITYSNYSHPHLATITGGACKMYAPGLRNSFAGELHTNGELYVTDNGANENFGNFSTDCVGGQLPAQNQRDRFLKITEGQCHGHPNMARGAAGNTAECTMFDDRCVKPLVSGLLPSTNGVLEYRSNLFTGSLKGNILLSRFSDLGEKTGGLARVQLTENGTVAENGVTSIFNPDSGLSLVEGPRGEIIMSRVYRNSFYVLKPECVTPGNVTYFIGVQPRRGPAAGGQRVLISGYNFGAKPSANFGAEPCSAVNVLDNEAFTCVTPPGIANTQVKVVVTGTTGENVPTKGADYWYW